MGIVSKKDLKNIIAKVNNYANFNQQTNNITFIYWFKTILNKRKYRSTKLDIAKFYPSITEDLLDKSNNFTTYVTSTYEKVIK